MPCIFGVLLGHSHVEPSHHAEREPKHPKERLLWRGAEVLAQGTGKAPRKYHHNLPIIEGSCLERNLQAPFRPLRLGHLKQMGLPHWLLHKLLTCREKKIYCCCFKPPHFGMVGYPAIVTRTPSLCDLLKDNLFLPFQWPLCWVILLHCTVQWSQGEVAQHINF